MFVLFFFDSGSECHVILSTDIVDGHHFDVTTSHFSNLTKLLFNWPEDSIHVILIEKVVLSLISTAVSCCVCKDQDLFLWKILPSFSVQEVRELLLSLDVPLQFQLLVLRQFKLKKSAKSG